MTTSAAVCAHEILEVVPQIMRAIRTEMRRHRTADLSVPQFRTLAVIDRNANASLSDVAEHIGLTLPSMSKLIDGLVARKLVTRQTDPTDRRRMTLALTRSGQAALEASRAATRACLAESLAALTDAERATVVKAMEALRPIFSFE
ncbi:MAG: MarR family transcriptional regulator [Chloroflexi bacterium]|nr:MarR family transcriptional regulator [Chloroflexota bacterium]